MSLETYCLSSSLKSSKLLFFFSSVFFLMACRSNQYRHLSYIKITIKTGIGYFSNPRLSPSTALLQRRPTYRLLDISRLYRQGILGQGGKLSGRSVELALPHLCFFLLCKIITIFDFYNLTRKS